MILVFSYSFGHNLIHHKFAKTTCATEYFKYPFVGLFAYVASLLCILVVLITYLNTTFNMPRAKWWRVIHDHGSALKKIGR